MATEIAGYVLRTKNRGMTARFYEDLGLITNEHQHGGPKHHEVTQISDSFVLELYQRSEGFPHDTLMVNVDSISVALEAASKYNIEPQDKIRDVPGMKLVYITDPDGRALMLIERQ